MEKIKIPRWILWLIRVQLLLTIKFGGREQSTTFADKDITNHLYHSTKNPDLHYIYLRTRFTKFILRYLVNTINKTQASWSKWNNVYNNMLPINILKQGYTGLSAHIDRNMYYPKGSYISESSISRLAIIPLSHQDSYIGGFFRTKSGPGTTTYWSKKKLSYGFAYIVNNNEHMVTPVITNHRVTLTLRSTW